MYKKILVAMTIVLALILPFTLSFANNGFQEATDGVRNVMGGAENVMEDAAQGISNTTKNITGSIENGANNMTQGNRDSENTAQDTGNNYMATRTSADGNTFMGMNSTSWTWLILGIAGIAIIALVWYYATQFNHNNYDDKND